MHPILHINKSILQPHPSKKKKKIEYDNYSLNTQMLKIHAYSMYLEFHYTDYNHLYEINRRKKH